MGGARLATEQDDDRVRLGGNETQQKHVATSAVVAFKDRFSQWTIFVQRDFLVLGAYEMVDDVTA